MYRFLFSLIFVVISYTCLAQEITLIPKIHSIGIKVELTENYDTDESSYCYFRYKKTTDIAWRIGFPLDRIKIDNVDQFRGSVFLVDENTSYDVEITLVDSIPTIISETLAIASIQTQEIPNVSNTSEIKYVSPIGSGNAYSIVEPGNLKILMSSGLVNCGTTIMLMDGIYQDYSLSLSYSSDCTEDTPIIFMAAPNATPIIDGGVKIMDWTQGQSDSLLYSASLPAGADFTNLCNLEGKLLYPYPTLSANILFGNYNLLDLNLDTDGFIRDGSSIRLKTKSGIDPNVNGVTVSKAFRFLTVYGQNHNTYLKFKGLTIRNISKSNVNGGTAFAAIAFDLRSVNHVLFDSCTLEFNNLNLVFSGQSDQITIQNCQFTMQNGTWSHSMLKKSNIQFSLIPTSMGRFWESSATSFGLSRNVILRNNVFEGTGSGVFGAVGGFMEETDVYNNLFIDNYDAIECDGKWVNLRVWENEIIRPMAGFSIAPPSYGPRYFYRNLVHHMKGRKNVQDDPYFVDCKPPTEYYSNAVGIKTNSGSVGNPRSNIYFINNTFHAADSLGFAYSLWDSEWKHASFINNILFHENRHPAYFHGIKDNTDFNLISTNDNYYTQNPNASLVVAKEIHGQYTCHEITQPENIQEKLVELSGSDQIKFKQTLALDPAFTSIEDGGFELAPNSPLINEGVIVEGFYDYFGISPDIGAKEYTSVDISNMSHPSNLSIYPNPSQDYFILEFEKTIDKTIIEIFSVSGTLVYKTTINLINQAKIDHKLPPGMYVLKVTSSKGTTEYINFISSR